MLLWFVLAADSTGVPGLSVLSGSILGIVLLLSLFGWVWFKPAVDDLKDRTAKAEQQRDDLIKVYEVQVIPVLKEVQEKVIPLLQDIKADIREDRLRRDR